MALAPNRGALSSPPVSAFRWCREDRLADRVRPAPVPVQPSWRRTRQMPSGHPPPQEHWFPPRRPDPASLCRANNRLD